MSNQINYAPIYCGICQKVIKGDDRGLAIFQANYDLMIRNTCPECTESVKAHIQEIRAKLMLEKIKAFEDMDPRGIFPPPSPSLKHEPGGISFNRLDDKDSPFLDSKEYLIRPIKIQLDTTKPIQPLKDEDL